MSVGTFIQSLIPTAVANFATNITGIEWALLAAFILVLIFGNTLLRVIAIVLIGLLFFGIISI